MAINLTPCPRLQFVDANGDPISGGKVYTYVAGTTTPLATYTDYTGATANANPVILDTSGRAAIWLTQGSSYKFVIKTSADVTVYTEDGISASLSSSQLSASSGSSLIGFIQSGASAVARTAQEKMREKFSVFDFLTVAQIADVKAGTKLLDVSAGIQAAINAIPTSSGGSTGQGGYDLVFDPGVYRIDTGLVIGSRRMSFVGAPMIGSNGTTIITDDVDLLMVDASTGALDTFSMNGIQLQGPGKGTGTGIGIKLGRSGQPMFDSRISNCWFTGIPAEAIYLENAADYHIEDNGIENSAVGVLIRSTSNSDGQSNFVKRNTIYACTKGVYVTAGRAAYNSDDNQICDNVFWLCGTNPGGTGDNTNGGIVIDSVDATNPSVRGTAIKKNTFRGCVGDIRLFGHNGLNGGNTGVNDTDIDGNYSDRGYRQFIYSDGANTTRLKGNSVNSPSQEADGIYYAFHFQGTYDSVLILPGNSISDQTAGSVRPAVGLSLAGTGTNVYLAAGNKFSGKNSAYAFGSTTFARGLTSEGAWQPTLKGDGTAGTQTYSTRNGTWTRSGDLVWASCEIVMTALDGATAGNIYIDGLPFPHSTPDDSTPIAAAIGSFSNITLAANTYLMARTSGAKANGVFLIAGNTAGAYAVIQAAAIAADTGLCLTIVYRAKTGGALDSNATVS